MEVWSLTNPAAASRCTTLRLHGCGQQLSSAMALPPHLLKCTFHALPSTWCCSCCPLPLAPSRPGLPVSIFSQPIAARLAQLKPDCTPRGGPTTVCDLSPPAACAAAPLQRGAGASPVVQCIISRLAGSTASLSRTATCPRHPPKCFPHAPVARQPPLASCQPSLPLLFPPCLMMPAAGLLLCCHLQTHARYTHPAQSASLDGFCAPSSLPNPIRPHLSLPSAAEAISPVFPALPLHRCS
jgi:hypothetical protein